MPPSYTDHSVRVPESAKEAIERSNDPERVSKYFEQFETRWPGTFERVVLDADRLHWLALIFSSSRFLSEELMRHPDWILTLDTVSRSLSRDEYGARLTAFLSELRVSDATAMELALFRRKELLRIVVRDQLGIGVLSEITEELSNLADSILERALDEVTRTFAARYGSPFEQGDSSDSRPATFAVLALGKLGGRELNYSSDIDLMFLYSANGETSGPERIINKEFFKKIANQLTNLLSTYTPAGQCYRVDLRLRPEGSHGEICIPLAAAQEYYGKRARGWELQALLKARVAAGDERLGRRFLDSVAPLVYSTTLDFSTIESMSAAREQIREKISKRPARGGAIDIKHGRGGIRDIEFLVQCLQRLHGNREQSVKDGGTLPALARLHASDLLSNTEYSRLAHAYSFLRKLEHVLQFEDDRQIYVLPSDSSVLERIARRASNGWGERTSGIAASTQLLMELNQHLENVQAIYDRIVRAQRPLYYGAQSSSREAPVKAEEVRGGTLNEEVFQTFRDAAPELMERVLGDHDRSFKNGMRDFLAHLSQRPEDLKLFSQNPKLRAWVAQVFDMSPLLGNQLTRHPELLEEIRRAADHPGRSYAFEGLAAPLMNIDALRRFFRREMFRTLVASVCVPEPVFQTLDQTSALAEFVIARAYRIALEMGLEHAHAHATAEKPFEEPQNEMMVVALGRLGMREFDIGSDADLLFIVPDGEAVRLRFWTRVVERLLEILSAYTDGGATLSVDTRLRPNGREGPLVQSESKYVEYFSSRAEAWEGIAYMKARGVAGDTERATKFLTQLQQVDWRRYGQGGRSKLDLRQMRLRLQREQGSSTPLKAALGGYYDADFILMYLRLRGAGMFFKSLNTPERIDVVEKMGHLDRADAEFLQEATTYFRALDHALRLVTGHSEGKIPASEEQREMVAELMTAWTVQKSTAKTLEADLNGLQTKMHRLFETVFVQ